MNAFKSAICGVVATALLSMPSSLSADGTDRPSCKKLEAVYIELARRSGEEPTEAEIKEAVYSANPTDAECAAMLALFPATE